MTVNDHPTNPLCKPPPFQAAEQLGAQKTCNTDLVQMISVRMPAKIPAGSPAVGRRLTVDTLSKELIGLRKKKSAT